MISRLGLLISRAFRSVMPDPFVLAVVLTFATIALALLLTPTPFPKVIDAWSSDLGIWSLLKFAMQMSLILVTGYALATSPPVARLTRRLAQLPTTGANAAALVAVLATTTGVLNWGLGLIVGAVAAREVGAAMHRKGISVHYPLLAAAGYLGLMVWHGGFSGTAPLKVTRAADIAEIFGATPPISAIPLDRTLFSPMNLFITGGLLILLPLIMAALAPRDAAAIQRAESFGISDNDGVVASAEPTGEAMIANRSSRVFWRIRHGSRGLWFCSSRSGRGATTSPATAPPASGSSPRTPSISPCLASACFYTALR